METPSGSVDSEHLSFSSLVGATHNLDSISLANRNRSYFILGLEILADMTTHDLSSETGWRSEMSLSRLSSLTGHSYEMLTWS